MSTVNHNLNNRPIGFFDSGVGGLSVYSRFKKVLPYEDTLYYGDLAHLPYGNKTKSELVSYARNILDFYKEKQVKAVVIACNTSSAQAYDTVKDEYDFRIYPIIQSCARVIASQNNKRLGIFATLATVASGAYTKELKKYNPALEVKEVACPNWVNIVESGRYKDESAIEDVRVHVKEILEFSPEKIILGCTHYPFLIGTIRKIAGNDVKIIDPAPAVARHLADVMKEDGLLRTSPGSDYASGLKPDIRLFSSGNPRILEESFNKLIRR